MKVGDKFVVTGGGYRGQEGVILRKESRGRDPIFLVRMNSSTFANLMCLSWMAPIETAEVVEGAGEIRNR